MPVVTVVVIVYNDAARLPAAVRSATRQSLRDLEVVVVDDASTDATPRVAARLEAADPRVRVVRLDTNSGGCSRPRNVGLEHATGDYVLFLDSDDVLPRRACERLYAAARRADADMACGRLVRRHHHPPRHIGSHDELYLRPAVLESVLDRPEQLWDTPSCGKLYRRSFLDAQALRFPEGLLYEDLLFTTQAYCSARRIAVVPQLVYVWNVRHDDATPSITNRRDLRAWRDRFEVHRRIDRYLTDHHAADALRAAKDRKFLDVDFALFLRDLRDRPAAERPALLAEARYYVCGLDVAPRGDAAPASRLAAYLAGRGDPERTLTAADYSATGGIGSDVVVRDGRLFWTGAHLDTEAGRDALDITETGLLDASFASTPFLAAVSRARVEGATLHLTGGVHDVLGRLGDPAGLHAALDVTGRLGAEVHQQAAVLRAGEQGGVTFDVALDLREVGRRVLHPRLGHELWLSLVLVRRGERARVPLTGRDADLPAADLPLPTPWRALIGDRVRLLEANGRLVLRLSALPAAVDAAGGVASLARYAARRVLLRRRARG